LSIQHKIFFKTGLLVILTTKAAAMRKIFFCFSIFCSFLVYGQNDLKGIVVDEKNNPVPNASVFLSNTSVGTKAGDDGNFVLTIPAGKYDLVVSSVGYQTYTQTITGGQLPGFLTVQLKLKAPELETVFIEPFEKNGWEKWGLFFTQNFIGTSANALDCRIKNKEAVRFRYSKASKQLVAIAMEPLVIENKAMGYTITLQLEGFSYDFNTRYLLYTGYALFNEMQGSRNRMRNWKKAREDAYSGSQMHFMRSVYLNRIREEGFEVRRLRKIKNEEKQRVKDIYASRSQRTPGGVLIVAKLSPDSTGYYERILEQDDYFDVIGKDLLPGDSIAYAINSTTAGLEFEDYLLITYKKSPAPAEFTRQFPKAGSSMTSHITLINHVGVQVESNGNYYNPADLLSSGYWAWSEKMSMMLPFDFKVGD
jgi:hypothetical protein